MSLQTSIRNLTAFRDMKEVYSDENDCIVIGIQCHEIVHEENLKKQKPFA